MNLAYCKKRIYMKNVIASLFILINASSYASSPYWTCLDNKVRYDIDWIEGELQATDRAYIKTKNQKLIGSVEGMSENNPDVIFYDPNKGTWVMLLLDSGSKQSTSENKYKTEMHQYDEKNEKMGNLISILDCTYNF